MTEIYVVPSSELMIMSVYCLLESAQNSMAQTCLKMCYQTLVRNFSSSIACLSAPLTPGDTKHPSCWQANSYAFRNLKQHNIGYSHRIEVNQQHLSFHSFWLRPTPFPIRLWLSLILTTHHAQWEMLKLNMPVDLVQTTAIWSASRVLFTTFCTALKITTATVLSSQTKPAQSWVCYDPSED